jgi:hypothetical protein
MAVLYFNRIRGTNQAQSGGGQTRTVSIVTRHSVTLQNQKPKTGKPTVIRLRSVTIRIWESSSGELVIEVDPP